MTPCAVCGTLPSQASVSSEEERWGNVANAFQASPGLVGGKRVIILDDVCTTGSTLEACSLVLKAAGALSAQGPDPGQGGVGQPSPTMAGPEAGLEVTLPRASTANLYQKP